MLTCSGYLQSVFLLFVFGFRLLQLRKIALGGLPELGPLGLSIDFLTEKGRSV